MKWITLLLTLLLLNCSSVSTEVLESPQVTVVPAPNIKSILIPNDNAIDVTHNAVTYY